MLTEMGFAEFRECAGRGNLVPVYREVLADLLTPVSAFLQIGGLDGDSFLLESVEGGERLARYSFLGRDPFLTATVRGGLMTVHDRRTGDRRVVDTDRPIEELRRLLARWRSPRLPGLPRFTGGAVGWFGYDSVRWVESLPAPPPGEPAAEEMVLHFFDTVLAFDHVRRRVIVIANAPVEPGMDEAALRAAFEAAGRRADAVVTALQSPAVARPANGADPVPPVVRSNMEAARFHRMVETAQEYIRAGDIFQVVLSQRFAVTTQASPFDIYRALRAINPSPWMFFLNFGDRPVLGSSPEPLVLVHDGRLEYRPIAGTAPRGADEAADRRAAEAMLADDKERAEHVMLVDLGRSDLGRVAEPGSVVVDELMSVERYSHVMHLVSRLTARLRPGCDALDALYACFPAGTVSGAPKVRAMEIIDELEPTRRGLYAGAVGYLDFAGNLDTCIALRTMTVHDGTAWVQAGAGIVADSRPDREYEETMHKARALLSAIEAAARGLDTPGQRA